MFRGTGSCFLVILLCAFAPAYGRKGLPLPSYLNACSKSDPKINECFVRNANLGIPDIVNGDKKYKIPVMVPLKINEVKFNPNDNFKLTLTNILVHGLDEATVTGANVDIDNLKLELTVAIPEVVLISDYDVHGKALVPIEGTGPANLKITRGEFTYSLQLELIEKNGEQYAQIKDSGVQMKWEKVHFRLDNLFNGNKELGDQTNALLNENSQELGKDFYPAIRETINTIITTIISSIIRLVPWNNFLLP